MSAAVGIVDYGLGNMHSVLHACRRLGAEPFVVANARALDAAERLILPGVGAYADGMAGLRAHGLDDALRAYAASNRPLWGICLGMQLMLDGSDEFGEHSGLGIIPGWVRRIAIPDVRVPHVGWQPLQLHAGGQAQPWLGCESAGQYVYFVHSYVAEPAQAEDRWASVAYGTGELCAAIGRGRVLGTQFHPEKSGHDGLAMLRRFLTA